MRTVNGRQAAGLVWQRSSFDGTAESMIKRDDHTRNRKDSRDLTDPDDSRRVGSAEGGQGCLQLSAERGTLLLRESEEPDTVLATRPARVAALLFAIKAGGWRARRR